MAAQSSATTVWEGGLARGSGVTTPSSGAFAPVDVTWVSRTARSAGKTSPEELLAAAHASCYCMALSHELDEVGMPPDRLETTATVAFVPGEGVKSSHLNVLGKVPGIDLDGFEAAAAAAAAGCPISAALQGNIEITIRATLES
jgi:lipoyl-dependent peroxiredoxin